MKPKKPKTAKDFKAKSIPTRNASKNRSKRGGKGVSRTKKPSEVLLYMIERANTAHFDKVRGIFERDDKVLKKLRARVDKATTEEDRLRAIREHDRRRAELSAQADKLLENVKIRRMLLSVITLAEHGDISYVRECTQCQNIFFAGRKDQQGCSPACLNKIRKQRWRKNYAEARAGERRGYLKKRANKR